MEKAVPRQTMLIWDAHSCVPLHPDFDLDALERHRRAGAGFVSLNVGMDMNPLPQILTVLASFRAQIRARSDRFVLASGIADVLQAQEEGKLAVAFDLEGGMPLCGRPEMVSLFFDLGVRQMHLAYNRNNALGGGCYDEDVPLTALGRRVVEEIYRVGMLMDLSHTGHRTSLDIISLGLGPVVFSHANPRALRDDLRNLTDRQIDGCAESGGVVCVTGVGRFLPDPEARAPAIADCIDYLVDRIGVEHVGISLDYEYPSGGLRDLPEDFDRAYWWPPEQGYVAGISGIRLAPPERLGEIAEELDRRGYPETARRRILGENMRDLAARVWPQL